MPRRVPEWPPPPPESETEQERSARVAAENEARRVSDAIDEVLLAEREQRRLTRPIAKVLLLGQAESGKSTVLKNLQLHFAPNAFRSEAELWRPVIHLNLLRSINFVLDLIHGSTSSPIDAAPRFLGDDVRRLCLSLTPLKQVEDSLTTRISGFIPVPDDTDSAIIVRYHPSKASEVSVRSRNWKDKLKLRRTSGAAVSSKQIAEDIQCRRVINACSRDMKALWENRAVQDYLLEREITLKDQPGFFLDDIERVADENFIPESEDILRARVQTIGPEEHHIPMEKEGGREWVVYDVGGSRSQRAAWAQFFEDVTAIIFLAPASGFNQNLTEEPDVNRLADTLQLWRTICSNKLLQSVQLILFLNKMDILNMQLKSGVQFGVHVTSYKNRPNDTASVAKYLVDAFMKLHTQLSAGKQRQIFAHMTCATDTKATSLVILQIQQVIMLKALEETHIL